MIPEKSNKEWERLVTGENQVTFSSFSLQMAVARLNLSYKNGKVSMQEAIDELYGMCNKYQLAMKNDVKKIFNI